MTYSKNAICLAMQLRIAATANIIRLREEKLEPISDYERQHLRDIQALYAKRFPHGEVPRNFLSRWGEAIRGWLR